MSPQMKEENKTPEKELNEMEASNLPYTEFKILVIRMLNELRRIGQLRGNLHKEIEIIKITSQK